MRIAKLGASVMVEQSAGTEAGYPDDQYVARGARVASRAEVFGQSDIVVQVRSLGANPDAGRGRPELAALRPNADRFRRAAHRRAKRSPTWRAPACPTFPWS